MSVVKRSMRRIGVAVQFLCLVQAAVIVEVGVELRREACHVDYGDVVILPDLLHALWT